MARFTSGMLGALMCSLAFSYILPAHANKTKPINSTDMIPIHYSPERNSTGTAPMYNSTTNATTSSSTGAGSVYYAPNTNSTGMAPVHHPNSTDDGRYGETAEVNHQEEHTDGHQTGPEESTHDQLAAVSQYDQQGDPVPDEHSEATLTSTDDKPAENNTKVDWRDIITEKYQKPIDDWYTSAVNTLHEWGLLSTNGVMSAASSTREYYDSSSKDDKSSSSNSYDKCTMNEFDYNSRSCKAYGMFDDAKYNKTTTAYTRSKGLMAFSDPLYMSKSELSGRTLSQLGVHFAICEDYNKKSGAQFRMGLYEKQRTSSKDRSSSWGGKSENWTMVAKTDLQKFNRRSDEYAMFSVDANSTIALKSNTYYTIITTIAPGSSMTMYTDDADSRPFSSFDFSGSDNNLPKSWDGKKSRSWSAVSMELAMCRNKSNK